MRRRRRRRLDDGGKNCVEVVREVVAARINIDGGGQSFYTQSLLNASTSPVLLGAEDADIFFAEMMTIFPCVLQHCRLILAKSVG